MGKDSHIEWTDHTFNPWIGCTKVSPGCAHCYAETLMDTRYGRVKWGNGNPRSRTADSNWKQPLKWNRDSKCTRDYNNDGDCDLHPTGCPRPRVFCASLADWLDDEVPIEWLADLLALIKQTPNLDWLLLTKRPQNWASRMEAITGVDGDSIAWSWLRGSAPANVWIGTSVEDQIRANERIPSLRKIPARVRFLSMEPLLGHVSLYSALKVCASWSHGGNSWTDGPYTNVKWAQQALMPYGWMNGVDWVIVGGESGAETRPQHPDWARAIRDQCIAAGVPFLFKQWGEWLPVCEQLAGSKIGPADTFVDAKSTVIQLNGEQRFAFPQGAMTCLRVGKKAAGRLLDGREWNELPAAR